MDYKDYLLNKQELHFWHKARKKLIYKLLNSIYYNYSSDRKILDVGCGAGAELKELKKFGNITAIDKNVRALNKVKEQGYEIILADIENYKLQRAHYNAICCFDILEHLKHDQQILNNIHSSLKKDGYLFFSVPAFQFLFGPHDIALEHFRRYNKKNLSQKLNKAGFKSIEIYYWNSLLFPLEASFRIIKICVYKLFNIKKYQTETSLTNKYINAILFFVLKIENKLFFKNKFLPFGLTIYGTAKK